jgi:flagellar hook-associated protein 3 FlgL
MIRSTQNTVARQTLSDLTAVSDRLTTLQRQLSTGKRINQPEDDPYGTTRALSLRDEQGNVQQYQRNIDEATAWLDTNESAMNNVTNVLQRVREVTVQAANGTQDASGLKAISDELVQLKETLRSQANTTFGGRAIFSGTATQAQPYPAGANTYAGNANPVQRTIGDGQTIAVNQTGTAVFGPDGSNVFDVIDGIVGHLASADRTALSNDLTTIDGAADRLSTARSNVGALTNRLQTQRAHLEALELTVTDLLSKLEDADMASTMIGFSTAQSVYQSALQAGAKVIQPSLMDFLR